MSFGAAGVVANMASNGSHIFATWMSVGRQQCYNVPSNGTKMEQSFSCDVGTAKRIYGRRSWLWALVTLHTGRDKGNLWLMMPKIVFLGRFSVRDNALYWQGEAIVAKCRFWPCTKYSHIEDCVVTAKCLIKDGMHSYFWDTLLSSDNLLQRFCTCYYSSWLKVDDTKQEQYNTSTIPRGKVISFPYCFPKSSLGPKPRQECGEKRQLWIRNVLPPSWKVFLLSLTFPWRCIPEIPWGPLLTCLY